MFKVQYCVAIGYICILKLIVGFGQGVRRSVGSIAAILGPLWAGASLHLYHVLLGVHLGILTGLIVRYR